MKHLYILKVGTTFATTRNRFGDFDAWLANGLRTSKIRIKVVDVTTNEPLPNLKKASGFIITGSHCMVTDNLPWSVALEKYIIKISKTMLPLLGICYGHQLIAKALGGKSDFNPKGKEIGAVTIHKMPSCSRDPLFKSFPTHFHAYETHYQCVTKLPPKAKIVAKNNKSIQSIRFRSNIWGVQFHPEFDNDIMQEYIIHQKDDLISLGFDVEKLLKNKKNCKTSQKIVTNFGEIVRVR